MTTEAGHVYKAITAVMATMARDGIAKTRNNAQQGYKFRGIDDVYGALSAVLAAEHLCMLPRVVVREHVERQTKSGGTLNYTILEVEFDLVSSVDGSKHTIRTVGEAMDSADKSSNKAMSAATKYACLVAFQIPTEGDDDADAHTPAPAPSSPRKVVNSGFADPAVAAAMDGYAKEIAAAADVKALMSVYSAIHSDTRLAPDAREFITQKLSTRRREIESKPVAA